MSNRFKRFDGWDAISLINYIAELEALATEAGKALGVYAECWCNREFRVDDEGNEHLVEELCGGCAILTKLAAAGLLPASPAEGGEDTK